MAIIVCGALAVGIRRRLRGDEKAPKTAQVSLASTRRAKATPTPTPTPAAPPLPKWAARQVISEVPVAKGKKVVALTFDDGPWPKSTNEILAILRKEKVKATFFMVGQEIARRPDVAQRVSDDGHSLAGHSFTHAVRSRDPRGEISRTDAGLKKILQFTPTIYRPPYGMVKNAMTRRAQATGKAIILWSSDSRDWQRPGAARITSSVMRTVRPGGIVLLHDGGGHRTQTIAALPKIIKGLRARGYTFVTVPELLAMRAAPKPRSKPKSAAKKPTVQKKPKL